LKPAAELLDGDTIARRFFFVVVGNLFLFFAVGVFFNGGAFPYGEIAADIYVVDSGARSSAQVVPAWWFWTTFWHGLMTSLSISALGFVVGTYEAVRASRQHLFLNILGSVAVAIAAIFMGFLVVVEALYIAT